MTVPLALPCRNCGLTVEPRLRWRHHSRGGRAIEARCPVCLAWIQWVAQTPENVARTVTDDRWPPPPGGGQGTLFGES